MSAVTIGIIVAIVFGPVSAIIISLWYQRRRQKIDMKEKLFITLMAHRKALPPTQDLVNALNLIDVVFDDSPKVITHWHEYYDLLYQVKNWDESQKQREHKYLELLSEMARSLGYRTIQQTDIDKFYIPRAHGEQAEANLEIQKEWLRVLKNTSRFIVDKKDDEASSS
jgi:hypothetical protein